MQWTLANWHWVNVVLSPAHYPSPPLDLPLMMLAVTFIEKFKVKTLERVVLNQLSSFLSNIIYWMLTNQDSDVDIQLRLCYSQSLKPCELQKLIPNHQFSSAGSICYFWHCQSSDPPVHPLITGHHWDSTSLVWILSHWQVFQGGLGRGGIRRTLTGHWGSSGIGSWTPPLLHINCITGSHHTNGAHGSSYHCYADETQLYHSFRPDDPTVAARISGCLADISAWMKEHHLQLNLAKTSCLYCHSNSTAWFHHPARFFYNHPIKFSQKSWCNFRWPADLPRPHCKNCLILPVCIAQHQNDQTFPYTASSTTSCPGPCHF